MSNDKKEFMVRKQTHFCVSLMNHLAINAEMWCDAGCPSWAGYTTPKNSGQNKTALTADITRLRRELLELENRICEVDG